MTLGYCVLAWLTLVLLFWARARALRLPPVPQGVHRQAVRGAVGDWLCPVCERALVPVEEQLDAYPGRSVSARRRSCACGTFVRIP